MISIEAKLNEALDKLKTISASKYKEVCEKLPTLFPNVEAQVQCVAEALKQFTQESNPLGLQGFELLEEAKREFPALFGVEPRTDGAKPRMPRASASLSPVFFRRSTEASFI